MVNLTNSHSLTEFQRNAKGFIEAMNENKEPLLITVNGKVQAVMVDPVSYQQMEAYREKERFVAAVKEGLRDIDAGRVRPLEDVYADMKAKHGF